MQSIASDQPLRGRSATLNPAGRFEVLGADLFDDGWGSVPEWFSESASPATEVFPEEVRSIISRNDSPDIPFEQSINPYRGCEHGCIYCYARPSHSYVGLSPGLDFETKIFAKHGGPEALEKTLRRPSYRPHPIALGANTDPYQPLERRLRITRRIVELLWKHRHPFSIVTKSALVLRDLDLLRKCAAHSLVGVYVSVTSLDAKLAQLMEPRAAAPKHRLRTIRELSAAGVPVGVMTAPIIPGLNDSEIEAVLGAAREAGATSAGYVLLRLPYEVKDLFRDWLKQHFPEKHDRIMHLVQETRGGREYDARFGQRHRGTGHYADLIGKRFANAVRRNGLNRNRYEPDDTLFLHRPEQGRQLNLL